MEINMSYDDLNYLVHTDESEDLKVMRTSNLRLAKKTFSRIGIGYGVFVIVYVVSVNILALAASLLIPNYINTTELSLMLTIFSIYGLALPILLLTLCGTRGEVPEKKKFRFLHFAVCMVICMGLMYIGSLIGNLVSSLVSVLFHKEITNNLNEVVSSKTIFVSGIYTVILAPIGEEFVFRKLIVDRTQRFGALPSMLISGLLFGLMHGNFYQFFYAAMLGCVLAYIYYNTGNLFICIAIHCIINFIGTVVSTFLTTPTDNALITMIQLTGTMLMGFAVIAFIVSAIVLLIVLRKRIIKNSRSAYVDLPGGKVLNAIFLNPGMIVGIVAYILLFVYQIVLN